MIGSSESGTSVTLDRACAQRWLSTAILSLLLAGIFSLLLVLGRVPYLAQVFTDPLFFRRCLVVHVNLSLVVWFCAFGAALFFLIPRSGGGRTGRAANGLATLGVVCLMAAAGMSGARPILSNYVPVIDHKLFLVGFALFGAGLAGAFLDSRLLATNEAVEGLLPVPSAARVGLRACAVAMLLALVTFVGGFVGTPKDLVPEAYYELAFWGGGHVLQVASVAGMLSGWLILLGGALARPPMRRSTAAVLFGFLVLPLLVAPSLAARGTILPGYRAAFTRLMEWGIFPVVVVFLFLCGRAIVLARREGRLPPDGLRDGRLVVFAASALMTLYGFLLGASIRGSNTVVPAHYHAAVGAVTLVYMALTYPLLEAVGLPVPTASLRRLARWQPPLFAVGQTIFATGFALAGATGMLRKTYGAEQQIRSLTAEIGLVVMGSGGLIAVASGVLFLWIAFACWRGRERMLVVKKGEMAWQTASTRISGY